MMISSKTGVNDKRGHLEKGQDIKESKIRTDTRKQGPRLISDERRDLSRSASSQSSAAWNGSSIIRITMLGKLECTNKEETRCACIHCIGGTFGRVGSERLGRVHTMKPKFRRRRLDFESTLLNVIDLVYYNTTPWYNPFNELSQSRGVRRSWTIKLLEPESSVQSGYFLFGK
jgi:hypothetical protein